MTHDIDYHHDLRQRARPGTPGPWAAQSIGVLAGESLVAECGMWTDARAIGSLPDLYEAHGELLAEVERLRGVLAANSDPDCSCQTCTSLSAALAREGSE